ncbi:MAG: hypothetical protein K6E87_04485 [bacterium]|nr:hypothetical protein [bacterium]
MDIFSEFKDLQKLYNNIIVERFNDAPFSESFECIYDVIEYIYECEQNGEEVSDDIFDLFTFGYRYLNEKFLYINSLYDRVYKTDDNLKAHYADLDLLFYVMDFITDAKLENLDYKELEDLEEEIFKKIENKEKIESNTSERIDNATKKIFRKGFHGFMESFEVLYDAITFGTDEEKDDGEFFEIDK